MARLYAPFGPLLFANVDEELAASWGLIGRPESFELFVEIPDGKWHKLRCQTLRKLGEHLGLAWRWLKILQVDEGAAVRVRPGEQGWTVSVDSRPTCPPWGELFQALRSGATAQLACPACGHAPLGVTDQDRSRFLTCSECGAWSSLSDETKISLYPEV